jgi:hypothetical protein
VSLSRARARNARNFCNSLRSQSQSHNDDSFDSLQLADEGKAAMVTIPPITLADCRKALLRARPTVSEDDLVMYSKFTSEFGEDG